MKKTFSLVAVALLSGAAFAEVTDGEYIIQDIATGKYLGGANSWGTQASLVKHGARFTVAKLSEGVYNLDSHTYNSATSHFFSGTYVDGAATSIYFTPSGDNYVLSTADGSAFVGSADGNVVANTYDSESAIKWKFISLTDAAAAFKEATEENPVDATFLIKDASVSRNLYNPSFEVAWQGSPKFAGDNTNFNAEKYNTVFDVYQEISVPNGTYEFNCQGFYRNGDAAPAAEARTAGTEALNAVLYANEVSTPLPSIFENASVEATSANSLETTLGFVPNSQANASVSFSDGQYVSNKVTVVVTNGKLRLGVRKEAAVTNDWSIFDNFELYCIGLSSLAEIQEVFAKLVAKADSLAALPMDAVVLANLQAATATPEQTADAYNEAIAALTAAIETAELSTMRYDNSEGRDVTALAASTWTGATGTYGARAERYNTATYVGDVMTQTISGLVPGASYSVTLDATASYTSGRGFEGATGDELTGVFANGGFEYIPVLDRTGVSESDFGPYTVVGTVGKDGTLTYGLKNVAEGGNWFVISVRSIVSAGNTNVASYSTVYVSIDAIRDAITAAAGQITNDTYADIVAQYAESLNNLSAQVNRAAFVADSLYNEVAISGKADSIIGLLPTVEDIEGVVTAFNEAIADALAAYDAAHPSALKTYDLALTQVNYDAATESYGSILKGETITVGYNKISATDEGSVVAFGNTAWGVNYIGYAKVDISKIRASVGQLKSAILTVECSGSTDSKRTAGIGIGYNDSEWSETMTYESADKSITVIGDQQWTSNKSSAVFETLTFDITEALAADEDGVMNLLIYNTQAAGAYLKNPILTVDYYMAPTLKVTPIEDFESKELADYSADWTIGVADRFVSAFAERTISGQPSRYFTVTAAGTNGSTHTYNKIAKTEAYQTADEVVLDFDFAMSAIANGSGQTQSLTIKDAEGNALVVMNNYTINNVQEIPSPIKNAAGDTIGYFELTARTSVANYFYHVNVATSAAKTVLTITDVAKDSVVATLDLVGGIHVGALTYGTGKTYGMLALDEITYGVYTYDEIIEDPVITATGESYDPLTISIVTETEGATIKYTIDGGEEQVYEAPFVINQTSTIAAWAEKNGSASNVITKKFVACVTPAPTIANAGETFGANTITITSNVPSAVTYYTINDGDVQTYTDEFVTDESITVAAWNVYEERYSDTTYLSVTAGEIATPVVTLASVDGDKRYIAFATATDTAKIVYALNDGAEVVGKQTKDTIVIESDTKIKVWARFVENEKIFESAAVDTAFQAGTQIQLAGVDITTEDYSAVSQTADLKLSTSQLEVLLNPAVEINWAYGDQSGVAANGDIIKNVPVGATFTAYAKAAGYVDSEVSSVEIVPSYASTIFNEDYEDGTTGSWTMQIAGMLYNVENTDGTHSLNFFQSGQGGDRWAKLVFPEYSSSAYTLSFKWAVAAGNGSTNRFYVYAGSESDILFRFETGTDMDTNPGERVTTVYDKDDNVIGTFTEMQTTRFVLPEKYATVEVTVSASGTVLTIVNNLGQTQVKTKISDEPVVITELHEILGRAYGSWAIDDVKIAGRSGSIMAPEFALDHYDVVNPAVVITDATDKTEIYYRAASTTYSYDEDGNIVAGEYTFPEEYTKYEAPVVFTNEATIVEAYAIYEGLVESPKALSTVFLKLTELAAPTVAFVSADTTEVTSTFSVADNTSDLISATLYYQGIGQESASVFEAAQITTDPAAYGWFNVYAQVGDLKSPVVYRYVDARGVYTEPYVGISGSENVFPETIGDFEAAVGATVSGAYPENYLSITGTQYVHVALTENYSVVTLPFTFTVGTNVITNAKGDTLALNEDYELYTLHTRAAQNTNNNKDLSLLANVVTIANAKRGEGVSFSENVAVLIRPLTEKVGSEVVLHSAVAAPIKANVGNATVPTNGGWRIFANGRYENITLESAAYVLDAAGEKFVYTENPVIPALGAAIIIDPASVASFGNEIILVGDPAGIENIATGDVKSSVYDLQGRKAQSVKKGIFVVDGKAVLVK